MTNNDITICGHGSGRPRLTILAEYAAQRYAQHAKNGKDKGIVAVRRLKKMTDQGRECFRDTYKKILGRNYYDQDLRQYVYTAYKNGNYYSDCSSSICATYAKIGYSCPLYNTAGIYQSSIFEDVPVRIEKGQIANPEILKVGDAILFRGDDSSRPLQIGHVEAVYSIADAPEPPDGNVAELQDFLNTYYRDITVKCSGILTIDNVYGEKTRAAALGVWKYMCNKYYGTRLTIGNDNFYESSKKAAAAMTEAEVRKHPTLGTILQGILSGKGYYSGALDCIMDAKTKDAIEKMTGSRKISAEMWSKLFN